VPPAALTRAEDDCWTRTHMIDALKTAAALAALCLLGFAALRHMRRHRVHAVVAASFLLIFGVNVAQVSPPPPREIEAEQHEEEDAEDDEPK
jgi:hypothetical protein